MDVVSQEDLKTYESLIQEVTREYYDIVDSKWWEPATRKEKSQDQPSLPKACTVAICHSFNNYLNQVGFKSRRSGNCSGSRGLSSDRSNVTLHKFVKKGYLHKYFSSKGTGSIWNPPKKSENDLPECVTKRLVVSDTKDLATSTITCNNNKYKWCTSCNNGQGAWGFHWKDGHEEWKNKQGKNPSVHFFNPANNSVIYCSYLITTSE